jgi:hypothetical protein
MIKITDILKQILLEEKAKRDRCLRIADRKFDKPSAYKSGAVVRCRKGDIWKDLKEELNNNHNQDSIKQVFEDAPELPNIGTIEQYTKYLETIFPNSKVKDIVYHRTRSNKFDKFNNKTNDYIRNDTYTKDGIYFHNDINRGKEVYGSTVIPAIVNIKNPYSFEEEGIFAKEGDNPKKISLNSIDKKKLSNEDGVLFRPGQPNGQTVVFEPEQTHILGSKQDIEGFQKYVSKTINEELIKEKTKETLRTWFKRQGPKGKEGGWIDCNAPDGKGGYKACGRKEGEKRSKYPSCRPTPSACKRPGKGKTWGKTK